jgi:hypothetical protein
MSTKNSTIAKGKYVVKRNGLRVSESIYESEEDAKTEYNHWEKIIKKWPDGSKLEIVTV